MQSVAFFLLVAASTGMEAPPEPAHDPVTVGLQRPLKISLSGDWHFREDPEDIGEKDVWNRPGQVRGRVSPVPLPWQLAFDDLRDYSGTGWYEKEVNIPTQYQGKRIFLATYGISNEARIWVNGKQAGEHRGVHDPFQLEITPLVRPGFANTVTIRAGGPHSGNPNLQPTGLWQEIWIEAAGVTFLADVYVVPDIDASQAIVKVSIGSPASGRDRSFRLMLTAVGPDGRKHKTDARVEIPAHPAVAYDTAELLLPIPEAKLWDVDYPNLYQLTAALMDEQGQSVDEVSTDFGMRKLEARGNRIFLNNKPIYLAGGGLDPWLYGGAGDVNFHQPPPYHHPTDTEIQDDLRLIKSLGVNFLRATLRPAPPRLLYWADRMGLLVWQDGPWSIHLDKHVQMFGEDKDFEDYKRRWANTVISRRNHPSAAVWGLQNESGGNSGWLFSKLKVKTAELYDVVKAVGGNSLILDNSGGWDLSELNAPENHGKTDLTDYHGYPPFHQFGPARALMGGAQAYGKPLLMSEFAPAPYIDNIAKCRKIWGNANPPWLDASLQKRFERWGLDKVYGDLGAFSEASDRFFYEGLKHQSELIRMNPELVGHVAWLFDVAPHPVGVVDYFREKKASYDLLARNWGQDAIILDIQGRRSFWSGESIQSAVHVSHFGDATALDGDVQWWLEDTELRGRLSGITVPAGNVRLVGGITLAAPPVKQAKTMRLCARIERQGKIVAENSVTIWVYPLDYRKRSCGGAPFNTKWASRFQLMEFEKDLAGPIVTTSMTTDTLRTLEAGGTVLLMIGTDWTPGCPHLVRLDNYSQVLPFLQAHGLDLGSKEQGGHGDNFFIRRQKGLFERIPFENPIAWPFQTVWPQRVILGVKAESQADILAGAYGNMIASSVFDSKGDVLTCEVNATIVQCRYGEGRLIVCTFDLLPYSFDDPVAMIMLYDLIDYASGPFEPEMRLK